MPLRYKLESIDEVPEALREHYKEDDKGHFVLDVDGAVPKAKLDEFRNNNIDLVKDRDAKKAIVDKLGIDGEEVTVETILEKIQKADDLEQRFKDKKLFDEEGIEPVVHQRTERMREEHQRTIEGLKGKVEKAELERDELRAHIQRRSIDDAITNAARDEKLGVDQKMIPAIMRYARAEWDVRDGKPVVVRDGNVLRGEDGVEPMTAAEWLEELRAEAPGFFLDSKGGGAQGGDNRGGGDKTPNPWKKETHNLTQQMRIQNENPALARKLMGEAGIAA